MPPRKEGGRDQSGQDASYLATKFMVQLQLQSFSLPDHEHGRSAQRARTRKFWRPKRNERRHANCQLADCYGYSPAATDTGVGEPSGSPIMFRPEITRNIDASPSQPWAPKRSADMSVRYSPIFRAYRQDSIRRLRHLE